MQKNLTFEKQHVEDCFSSPSSSVAELAVGDSADLLWPAFGLFPWNIRCLCFPPPAKLEKRRLLCRTTEIQEYDSIELKMTQRYFNLIL